jgi:hypothetical protein
MDLDPGVTHLCLPTGNKARDILVDIERNWQDASARTQANRCEWFYSEDDLGEAPDHQDEGPRPRENVRAA